MKKIASLVLSGFLLVGLVFAYQPTSQDLTRINALKTQFDSITTGNMKGKRDFYAQLKTIGDQFGNYEQVNYYLNELELYLITQVNNEKIKVKATSKSAKQDFVNQWSGGFTTGITTVDDCTGWYNTMDTISFANNFPTALMIATRYRETNCGYYLPANGDGPFQILSKHYGTGQITDAKFIQTMQDFIDFSKSKYQMYKTKLGINLTYTGFDMTGIIDHAALYNGGGIVGSITGGYIAVPNNPKYVYDGYTTAYSGAVKYGILPKFLKVLDWELKTNY